MISASYQALYKYWQALGIQYVPKKSAASVEEKSHHIVWQRPAAEPQLIFFNMDPETQIQDPETEDMFQKIVQAMGKSRDQVWFCNSEGRSFMDFFTWLKNQNQTSAPLVLMKKDPEILNQVQNAGAFDWVECFSLQSMKKDARLKKPTWEILKLLMEKK